jgi:hypothetical protein
VIFFKHINAIKEKIMAMLPSVFNASEHDASSGFESIPAGIYIAEIVKSKMKDTKDGTGKYLMLQFKIIEGDFSKRFVFINLNLVNKSAEAVQIAKSNLKSIVVACGLGDDYELEDSVDLHNTAMGIKVEIKPASGKWPASNEIKRFYKEEDMPEQDADNPFE